MNQPTTFFTGGFRIKGDVQLTGDIVQDPIKIGEGAETLENTIGIGRNATATGGGSTSVGIESDALAQHATAYGKNAQALAQDTTAIGNETTAPANWNTVVGYDAGSFQNGENIVLIGRKSEGQGDDSVAIGENARANGLQSSAIGKATSALAKNSSAFGQGATVTGDEATVVGQGVTLTSDRATSVGTGVSATAEGATGVGRGAVASAKNATAVGNGAEANGVNSAAIGNGVIVNEDNSFSFGNRNISLPIGRSFLYPANPGIQSVINFSVTSDAAAGTEHSYSFDVDDVAIFKAFTEADGTGGIQNQEFQMLSQVNANGNDILDRTTGSTIYDSVEEHVPQTIVEQGPGSDLVADRVDGFEAEDLGSDISASGSKIINSATDIDFTTGISVVDDGDGTATISIDESFQPNWTGRHVFEGGIEFGSILLPTNLGNITIANAEITSNSVSGEEQSYSFNINGSPILTVFSIADGVGGITDKAIKVDGDVDVSGELTEGAAL